MDGYEYEKKCAELLKAKGFTNVTVTPGSGDQGIDVLAHKGRKKYGIQCKYYEGTVGNKAVQEAFAGASFYDCTVAMVITNSKLTEPAKKLAAKLGVEFWEGIDAVYLQKNDAEYIKKQAKQQLKEQERLKNEQKRQEQQLVSELLQWQQDYSRSNVALKTQLSKIEEEYARKRQELYAPVSAVEKEKSQLIAKLESASFFQFSEKSRTKKRIMGISAEVEKLSAIYDEKLLQLKTIYHLNRQKIRMNARQSFPALAQEAIRTSLKTKIGKEYPDYSPDILLALYFSDKPMSGYDLVCQIPKAGNISKLAQPLVENGIIVKGYMLNDGRIVRTLEELSRYFGYYPRAVYLLPNPQYFEKLEDEICEGIAATAYTAEKIKALLSEKACHDKWLKDQQLKNKIEECIQFLSRDSVCSLTDIMSWVGLDSEYTSHLLRELTCEDRVRHTIKKGRSGYCLWDY